MRSLTALDEMDHLGFRDGGRLTKVVLRFFATLKLLAQTRLTQDLYADSSPLTGVLSDEKGTT